MERQQVKKSWLKRYGWILPVALLLLLAAAFGAFVSVYYHADETALGFLQSDDAVTVTETGYGWLFDGPSADTALIFYPGAKVEETAYAPLLHALAAEGMDVCLVKMPFRLAILNGNAAEKALRAHDYAAWYIGGHSMGGMMAAGYASEHADAFSGVILLAAYPIKQIPDPLTELLVVGSEDQIINRKRLKEGLSFAPTNYQEHVIQGGNHGQFGSYGPQRGDGAATIPPEEQVRETVRAIVDAVGK